MAPRRRIVVAMSGGVDSTTTAALLKRQGHDVIGVGLKLADVCPSRGAGRTCCGSADMDDARHAAAHMGIPFYVLNYTDVFEKAIIDYFCRSYLAGSTPNPCVECNRVVKFGRLLALVDAAGADYLATGHYARVHHDTSRGRYVLKTGIDSGKDQSYFLHPLSQRQLSRAMFPLGGMTKTATRGLARSLGVAVHDKPGSQDVCFLGDGDYRSFVAERHPGSVRPGPLVDTSGRFLGWHRGVAFYTVGQRRWLGLAAGGPRYVLSLEPATGTVVVGDRRELQRSRIVVKDVNWIAYPEPRGKRALQVKVRYRQPPVPATVSGEGGGRAVVSFAAPQVAAAPGQSAVFYDDDTVVGGGIIERCE